MRVMLKNSLARLVNGRMTVSNGGDIIETTIAEGQRLIDTNRGTLVQDTTPALPQEVPPKRVRRVPKE